MRKHCLLDRMSSGKLLVCLGLLVSLALACTSCKVWRTISTTSTYTQQTDTSKITTTISTRTVEECTGVKK